MFEQLGEYVKKALGVENPEASRSTGATADSEDVEGVDQRGSLNSERWVLVVKNFREAIDQKLITYYLILTKLYVSFN